MANTVKNQSVGLQRFYRLGQAPGYLGVKRDWFDEKVRPYVTEIKDGKKMVLFDRLDLDAWADQYKARNGRLGQRKEKNQCLSGSKNAKGRPIGKLRERSSANTLEKVLERI